MDVKQEWPICGCEVSPVARYPNYVCRVCAANPVDEDGRALVFSNIGMAGGFRAKYVDNDEDRDSHVCFINGIECWADEARFGGTVIQPRVKKDT